MDRRALVFVGFAVVCVALYPLADHYDGMDGWKFGSEGWAFVPVLLGVVYLVLALFSALDHRSHQKLGARPLGYDRYDLHEIDLHEIDLHEIDLHEIDLHEIDLDEIDVDVVRGAEVEEPREPRGPTDG